MNNILSKGNMLSVVFRSERWRSFIQKNLYRCKELPNIGNNIQVAPFHSCIILKQSTEETPVPPIPSHKKYDASWLPFGWDWRPRTCYFSNSGDLVQTLEYDPTWPKPDFELSDELKSASDDIKYMFSLATGSKAEIKEAVTRNILKRVQRHPNDFDSLEVKIALRTIQIRSLFDHSREFKKEIRGSRILLHNFIHKRNRLVKQLYRMDNERFNWLSQELQLKYVPQKLGGRRERYTRKWDLRRLTKEYCEKTINDKKEAYHEELKKQQAAFLKEKEEILAWIANEEKELANLTV